MTNKHEIPHTIETSRFGPVEVSGDEVIQLLSPLPPFLSLTRYVLLADPEHEPFLWLQSVEQPALFFIVAPYEAVAGPAPALTPEGRRDLGLLGDEQPEVYVLISLGGGAQEVTMNLLAPVYVNHAAGRGRQVVGDSDLALARVPLLPHSPALQGGRSGAGSHSPS